MGPTVFHLGRLSVSSYAALIDLGIIIGLVFAYLESRWNKTDARTVVDAALWALVAGIVSGRTAYVAIYWSYFAVHPAQILSLSQGGLAFQGAFIGGLLGLVGYTLWNEVCFWPVADMIAPGLALGQAIGWVGCLLNGCGYGLVTKGLLAFDLRDIYGIMAYRYPTQLMLSLLNLGIFMLLLGVLHGRGYHRFAPGVVFALYLLLNSAGLFILEFLRADETLYFGTLRWSQLLELGEFVAAVVALLWVWRRRQRARLPESRAQLDTL